MTNNKLINTLEDLGLPENEAKVYYASLSLGANTILNIARAANLKRTTVYTIVESLKHKGLMTVEVKGFKQKFVAQDPGQLDNIIEQRKQLLKNVMPEFSAMYNLQGGESLIKHYQGLEAVKTIYNNLLNETKPKSDYLVIADSAKWIEQDPKFYKNFQERRSKKPFNVKILTTPTEIAKEHKIREKNLNLQIKFLPTNTDLSTNIIIVPHKIVFHQIIPPINAIVVENKSIIHTNRVMFDLIWGSIKN